MLTHQDEIKSRSLTLFQMPELENSPKFSEELREACGSDAELAEAGEEFEGGGRRKWQWRRLVEGASGGVEKVEGVERVGGFAERVTGVSGDGGSRSDDIWGELPGAGRAVEAHGGGRWSLVRIQDQGAG